MTYEDLVTKYYLQDDVEQTGKDEPTEPEEDDDDTDEGQESDKDEEVV
jgi:hypothetical protein